MDQWGASVNTAPGACTATWNCTREYATDMEIGRQSLEMQNGSVRAGRVCQPRGDFVSLKARSSLFAVARGFSRLLTKSHGPKALAEMSERRLRYVIRQSGLFDARHYLRQVSGVDGVGVDPVSHYLAIGEPAGRQPNRLFDPSWYRSQYMTESSRATSPLAHYILIGTKEGRRPGPEFDPASYIAANRDVAMAGMDPLRHFLAHGVLEGRRGAFGLGSESWFGTLERYDLGHYADAGRLRLHVLRANQRRRYSTLCIIPAGGRRGQSPNDWLSPLHTRGTWSCWPKGGGTPCRYHLLFLRSRSFCGSISRYSVPQSWQRSLGR
jgi:hypothetical protein